jgi:hypothetical protein
MLRPQLLTPIGDQTSMDRRVLLVQLRISFLRVLLAPLKRSIVIESLQT